MSLGQRSRAYSLARTYCFGLIVTSAALEMEETEVLVNAVLEKLDLGTLDITIPDIDEKIDEIQAEIDRIKSTDPYQYKFLLTDPEAVKQKKQELRDELKEYENYGRQLDDILDGMLEKGVITLTWQMN